MLLHDADTYSVPGIHHAMISALPRILTTVRESGLSFALPA
jgi:hypothetical protein